ncbi:DUF6994 family protein [Aureibaculum conchae]|uniref:DUF6994 family protein n=1 Tax=Aureibaculum sp. 2308TA14-22 TaxID=3108392 RepID=UPI00339AFE0B
MNVIDITYDFRLDSKCGDPDTDSLKLYEAHQTLWNKTLPCGKSFDFKVIGDKYGRFLLKNKLYMNLSSDRMCPHFVGKYKGKFNGWLSESQEENFQNKVRTIGGHIVFPAHRKDGFTINQARGVSRLICDRFDLTIECIKRFYENMQSPLSKAIERYDDFFALFESFDGYIDFFQLQDFLTKDREVNFALPFDNFNRSPLPLTAEEYNDYRVHTLDLIERRNRRILNKLKEMPAGNNV